MNRGPINSVENLILQKKLSFNPIFLNGRASEADLCKNVCNYFIFLDKFLEFFDFS